MPDQPTVIIHNHAGGESKPPGREVARYRHPETDPHYDDWHWNPGPGGPGGGIRFTAGRTYVVYELDD